MTGESAGRVPQTPLYYLRWELFSLSYLHLSQVGAIFIQFSNSCKICFLKHLSSKEGREDKCKFSCVHGWMGSGVGTHVCTYIICECVRRWEAHTGCSLLSPPHFVKKATADAHQPSWDPSAVPSRVQTAGVRPELRLACLLRL